MSYLKHIVVRADGNKEIGFGHVHRTIALAEIFSAKTLVKFISRDAQVSKFLPAEFHFQMINGDELSFINSSFRPHTHLLVLDGYTYDQSYQRTLRDLGFDIVYIDDVLNFRMHANVVLNPSLGISKADYQGSDIRYGLGPSFACLRKDFLDTSKASPSSPPRDLKKVFISFGGSDRHHISEKLINILYEFDVQEIHVMKGDSFDGSRVRDDTNLFIHENLSSQELTALILSVDLCINSASTVSYEVASINKPMIVGWYADNQKNLYNGLLDHGLAAGMGNVLQTDDRNLRHQIDLAMESNFHVQIEAQRAFFDGHNNERLASLVFPLLTKLSIRNIEERDMLLFFNWANDPGVRTQSITTGPITLAEHQHWFKKRLNSDSSKIFVIQDNNQPIGQIRFDLRDDGKYEIGYSIDREHRGKGLGKHLVALGIDKLRREDQNANIMAVVKHQNVPSLRAFRSLGFRETIPRGHDDIHTFEYFSES